MLKGLVLPKQHDPYGTYTANIFCGIRMMDAFGHINNAKYLEIMELARWQHGTGTVWFSTFGKGAVFPVVAGTSITFVREIKPWTTVQVSVQPAYADEKNVFIYHEITSAHPKTKKPVIHAAGLMKISLLPNGKKPNKSVEEFHEANGTGEVELDEEGKPRKKTRSKTVTPAEYFYRCGATLSPKELPEQMQKQNKEFSTYFHQINQGDDAWRKALRTRQTVLNERPTPGGK